MHAHLGEVASFTMETAQAAGKVLRGHFRKPLQIQRKKDDSHVTNADLASEKVIIEAIRKSFPEDVICSEESGLSTAERKPGSFIWVIDPLDGTTNFANGYECFAVSIGRGQFNHAGRIEITEGVVLDPIRDRCYVAAKGQGAYLNGQRLKVKSNREPREAYVATGLYLNTEGTDPRKNLDLIFNVAKSVNALRSDGSAALDMALVAEGIYDAYFEWGLKAWDMAAGQILVTEAGGDIRNFPELGGAIDLPFDCELPSVICGSAELTAKLGGIIARPTPS